MARARRCPGGIESFFLPFGGFEGALIRPRKPGGQAWRGFAALGSTEDRLGPTGQPLALHGAPD